MAAPIGEGFPREAEPITPVFDAMEALDLSVQEYLTACRTYAARPSTQNGGVVGGTISRYTDASHEYLLALAEGMTAEGFGELATKFLMDQDEQRVDALNSILGATDTLVKRETAPTIFDASEEPMDDETLKRAISSAVAELHAMGVGSDTQGFIQTVNEGPTARRLERYSLIKTHALRVGEVALGAAFGTVVGVWLTRQRG